MVRSWPVSPAAGCARGAWAACGLPCGAWEGVQALALLLRPMAICDILGLGLHLLFC